MCSVTGITHGNRSHITTNRKVTGWKTGFVFLLCWSEIVQYTMYSNVPTFKCSKLLNTRMHYTFKNKFIYEHNPRKCWIAHIFNSVQFNLCSAFTILHGCNAALHLREINRKKQWYLYNCSQYDVHWWNLTEINTVLFDMSHFLNVVLHKLYW